MKQLKYSEIKQLRSKLLADQDFKCLICGKDFIHSDLKPCLDHQHRKKLGGSGQIRGVLCSGCNKQLGKIENNAKRNQIDLSRLPEWLRECADYLEIPHLEIIHPTEKKKSKKLKKSCYNEIKKVHKGKMPKYTGRATKRIMELSDKYLIELEFYK